jgi:sugar lactone lactonase YvrE
MLRRTVLVTLALAVCVCTVQAAAPRFWRLEGTRTLLQGELHGLSLDSEGRLRLGPEARTVYELETPNAWSVATGEDGVLYVGTGNEGRLYRVEGDEGRVILDQDELEIHAVAAGSDGTVYAGTSPDGAVYAIAPDGTSRVFFDPEDTYIWDLELDRAGRLLVATGDEGRVYRVDPDGAAETLLSSSETHVLSLALDGDDRVYAGSAPEGIVYRIDAAGEAFVLLDSEFREIKGLVVGPDGAVFAAAVDGGAPSPPAESQKPSPPTAESPTPTAQVTVTESFAVATTPASGAGAMSGASTPPSTAVARGAVVRIEPTGAIETLWSSPEDVPHALASSDEGLLVGTGDGGKVYRVGEDGRWVLLATLDAKQITALAPRPGQPTAVVTSNPARVTLLSKNSSEEGRFVSAVQDAEVVAAWGQLRWEGSAPPGTEVRLATRSGNTSTPDGTWATWTDVDPGGPVASIRSESARFLQIRLTLVGDGETTPVIEALSAAYLQHNLRPRVDSITVYPSGQVFQKPISVSGQPEILGLDRDPAEEQTDPNAPSPAPPATAYSRKLHRQGLQTFAWSAADPNGDRLSFDVQYRAVGDERWRSLRERLTEAVLAWDTTSVADGRYVIRVTASDARDNPPSLALTAHEDSASFAVDNAPPALEAALGEGRRIRATARDAGTPIGRLELAVDAGRWQEVYPTDGINDSRTETYDFPVPATPRGGPHVVVLRVSDRLGNAATARVDVP